MYEVVFTPEAEVSFKAISQQLLQRWGDKKLTEFQKLTEKGVELIAKNPFLYQIVEVKFQIRKYPIHRNCSIIYRINKRKIEVICFYENRQNPIFI